MGPWHPWVQPATLCIPLPSPRALLLGWEGARGGPAPSSMDWGGDAVGVCAHAVWGDGEGEPPSHSKERIWHSRVSPWGGGGQNRDLLDTGHWSSAAVCPRVTPGVKG